MPEAVRQRQPEGYYLANFEVLLKTAADRYDDLLTADELAFLSDFAALSESARRLWVRLLSRQGPYFRADRLAYDDVPAIDEATCELVAAKFMDRGEDAEAADLLGLLLRSELIGLIEELVPEMPLEGRKGELLEQLISKVEPEELLCALVDRFGWLSLRRQEPVLVFRLLFFGNLYQDWTEFVLRDLGVVRYEAYELRREHRLFPDRQALDDMLLLRALHHEASARLVLGDLAGAKKVAVGVAERVEDWHPSTRRRVDRILNEVARELERHGEDGAALDLYKKASAPPSRERRTRLLAQRGAIAQALDLCEAMGRTPLDETEVDFARHFSHRLRRMRGEPLRPRVRRRRPTMEIALARREDVPVERLALAAFVAEGREGFFAENWLWKSLFGLAFWDIIFAPIDGAFQHPFQHGPLDLHQAHFRAARAEAIEERLEELRIEDDLPHRLMAVHDAKRGIANSLVSWHAGSRDLLEWASSRLTGRHLAVVSDRLSRDLQRYRRGFPDLFVESNEEPGFELFEVKAPGDQLRAEQRGWIDYLNEHGLPTSILKVTWRNLTP